MTGASRDTEPTALEREVAVALARAMFGSVEGWAAAIRVNAAPDLHAFARAAIAACFRWRPIADVTEAESGGEPLVIMGNYGKFPVVAKATPDFDKPGVIRWMVVDADGEVTYEPSEVLEARWCLPLLPPPPERET